MNRIKAIPAFNDNYIWMIPLEGRKVAVVDPGDAEPVLSVLKQRDLELSAILVTHHHFDHIGGIEQLLLHYPVPVYGPLSNNIPQVTHPVTDGESLTLGDFSFKIIAVPGHTLDHIAYYAESGNGYSHSSPTLFCGDTLFAAGCGRLFEGTPEQMHQSLTRLAALPDNTQVYCTHEYTMANLQFALAVEPDNKELQQRRVADVQRLQADGITLPSTIELERQTNPFLRSSNTSVVAAAAKHANVEAKPGAPTFALLRKWKDHFVVR
ncbi:hydroxyacylglutathione hydrolase [Porticoccaceae bacterium LTM1]|nr:hydroxyacylglutathione hydrolase [Porticoccaceae bacterium LTM1]